VVFHPIVILLKKEVVVMSIVAREAVAVVAVEIEIAMLISRCSLE